MAEWCGFSVLIYGGAVAWPIDHRNLQARNGLLEGGLLPDFEHALATDVSPLAPEAGRNIAPTRCACCALSRGIGQRATRATGRCTSPSKRSVAATAASPAHAATIVTLALCAESPVIRRRWFSILVTLCALMICYSLYLGNTFDGTSSGGRWSAQPWGGAARIAYSRLTKGKQADSKSTVPPRTEQTDDPKAGYEEREYDSAPSLTGLPGEEIRPSRQGYTAASTSSGTSGKKVKPVCCFRSRG